jgi:hypothetical protein
MRADKNRKKLYSHHEESMSEFSYDSEFPLLRLAPAVLRARDFRLYVEGGRRLVDLWQNGGAAVLGHTPPALLRELKNTASRGLYAPLPHFLEGRFLKALSRLFPGRKFRVFAAAPSALQELFKKGVAALWRPFLTVDAPLEAAQDAPAALVPVLPGFQSWRGGLPQGLCVLAFNPALETQLFHNTENSSGEAFPLGDIIAPLLLAAAVRGVYDLAAAAPGRMNLAYPRIARVLKNSPWQRRGIYLFHRRNPASGEWDALFRRFLEAGFLIPPTPDFPLILPGILSPGEEVKLAAALEKN